MAAVTLPAVTALGFALFTATAEAVRPPVLLMFGQLVALLVVPLVAGMALRRWRRSFFEKIRPRLQRAVLAAIVAIVAWILVDRAPDIAGELVPGFVAASLFLLPAMVLGEVLGRVARARPAERLAYVVELGFRNLALAVVVTVTLLRQEGFLAFATVFFVTAVVYALGVVAVFVVGKGGGPSRVA